MNKTSGKRAANRAERKSEGEPAGRTAVATDAVESAPGAGAPAEERPTGSFFRRIDWVAFWASFLASFAVYAYTLAPTVTLEDSGELAVAADYLGVPHPPGYPSWTIICWVFQKVFQFVGFRGHPNPAWSVGLTSAVFGALATGLTAMLVCRSGRDMLRGMRETTETLGLAAEDLICCAGGVSGSLIVAFSPVMWSQSVIVEVYSLNAFFTVVLLLLSYWWMCRPWNTRLLYVTGFLFGLGLTNHQTLLLVATALAFAVFARDRKLFLNLAVVTAGVLGLVYAFTHKGILFEQPGALFEWKAKGQFWGILEWPFLKLSKPGHDFLDFTTPVKGLATPGFLGFAILVTAWMVVSWLFLPDGRRSVTLILLVWAGLAFYGYLPWSSEHNPPMNWGYPRTWEGFVHAITRGQYEKIVPSNVFSSVFVEQVGSYMTDLREQFMLPFALAGFLPFTAWSVRLGGKRFRGLLAGVALGVAATALVAAEKLVPPSVEQALHLDAGYHWMAAGILAMLLIGGMLLVVGEMRDRAAQIGRQWRTWALRGRPDWSEGISNILFFGAIAYGYFGWYSKHLLRQAADPATDGFAKAVMVTLVVAPVLAAAGMWVLQQSRYAVRLDFDRPCQEWVIATLGGFLSMSVVLIVLANPKGDLQDAFIQRVKFISSHNVFSFWIGYGLIFGLAMVEMLVGRLRAVRWGALGLAFALPVLPILNNAYNDGLVRKLGGAEQNGHDFGWQFGYYSLRGANGIREELAPGEALPNPEYPPEMTPNAVFYGGTDPGRFVPTYMIYSAKVRPDVFLITQNALADHTYMSVMRDLYGDQIWIPSVNDSNRAFHQYVEDVRTGKMPPHAEIKIENGRVSVQGVQGVMLINGILAKMIFEHNKPRHDFYVEESYVIQWMYPYLEPHGIIMKICKEPMPKLRDEVVKDDMAFWAWYVKRLSGSSKFLRDVVARKSFSKLRSAIAGVYVYRNMFAEAEQAFKEAIELYPLSPEANFRLADLYLRWGKFDDARDLMAAFAAEDPGNTKAFEFVNQIVRTDELTKERAKLEKELAAGKGSVPDAMRLARIYWDLRMDGPFVGLTKSLLTNSNLESSVYLDVASLLGGAGKYAEQEQALETYLARVPGNMKAWVDLAAARVQLRKPEACFRALAQSVRIGGDVAREMIASDRRFRPIAETAPFRELTMRR